MRRLFVSDLHLDCAAPEAIEQFIEFSRTYATQAQALYILGDLFEVWLGDDDPQPDRERVCAALRNLSALGVACFILHGNRDFLLGDEFCRRTGCTLLSDPVVADFEGERVLLTHGDALCTDDTSYQELRSIVRTREWTGRFLALPLQVREALADRARAGSRAHTTRTDAYIMDVNSQAVEAAFRATNTRRMIHGHTHRPGVHNTIVDGEPAQRIVLGAWYEQGSYLFFENGGYELRELPRR